MATIESMAIRANAAADRIEKSIQVLGGNPLDLPRLLKEREQLRCVQLEMIADALEALPLPFAEMEIQPVEEEPPIGIALTKGEPPPAVTIPKGKPDGTRK